MPIKAADRYVENPAGIWRYITTLTASTSASLAYTLFASSNYKVYKLEINGLLPDNNNINLQVEGSVNGGLTYGALWSASRLFINGAGAATAAVQTVAQGYVLASNMVASHGAGGELSLYYQTTPGQRQTLTGFVGHRDGSTDYTHVNTSSARYDSATELNALRFSFTGGNITSGTIKIYGVT